MQTIANNCKQFLILAAFASFFLQTCQPNSGLEEETIPAQNEIKEKNGRLVFPSSTAYFATANRLGKLNFDELEKWRNQYKIEPLINVKLESTASANGEGNIDENGFGDMPPSVKSLLNSEAEIQIADTIIWYHKGKRHFALSEEELAKIKENPESNKSYGRYSRRKVEQTPDKNQQQLPVQNLTIIQVFSDIFGIGPDARYQLTFPVTNGYTGKYVHELWSYAEWQDYPGYYYYWTTLYLRVKLEEKFIFWGGWRPWPALRQTRFDLTSTVSLVEVYTPSQQVLTQINFGANYIIRPDEYYYDDYWIDLQSYGGTQCYCGPYVDPDWRVNLSGSIYQYTLNPYYTAYNNVGNPLW